MGYQPQAWRQGARRGRAAARPPRRRHQRDQHDAVHRRHAGAAHHLHGRGAADDRGVPLDLPQTGGAAQRRTRSRSPSRSTATARSSWRDRARGRGHRRQAAARRSRASTSASSCAATRRSITAGSPGDVHRHVGRLQAGRAGHRTGRALSQTARGSQGAEAYSTSEPGLWCRRRACDAARRGCRLALVAGAASRRPRRASRSRSSPTTSSPQITKGETRRRRSRRAEAPRRARCREDRRARSGRGQARPARAARTPGRDEGRRPGGRRSPRRRRRARRSRSPNHAEEAEAAEAAETAKAEAEAAAEGRPPRRPRRKQAARRGRRGEGQGRSRGQAGRGGEGRRGGQGEGGRRSEARPPKPRPRTRPRPRRARKPSSPRTSISATCAVPHTKDKNQSTGATGAEVQKTASLGTAPGTSQRSTRACATRLSAS